MVSISQGTKNQKLAVGRKFAQFSTETLATTLRRERFTPGITSDGLAVSIRSDVSGWKASRTKGSGRRTNRMMHSPQAASR